MPRFKIEAIETVRTRVIINITSKTAEAAKRRLQKVLSDKLDKWHPSGSDDEIVSREVISVKQLPSAAEEKAIREESVRRVNKIYERVKKYIKKMNKRTKIYVHFSAYEYEDEEQDLPIVGTLDVVPIQGNVVVFDHDSGYISPVMENPSWLQLCHIANEQIQYSDDHHHVFLESIDVEKRVPKAIRNRCPGGVTFCTFGMGS